MTSQATRLSLTLVLAASLGISVVQGGTVAEFDGGNSNAVVDGYPGMAGSGWGGAWTTSLQTASFSSAPTVVSTTPLAPGGGNYLTAALTNSSANGQGAVVRQYQTFGDVDLTKPHTIRFQYRPESFTTFSDGEDRFQAFTRSAPNHGTDANSDWMIFGFGGDYSGADVDGRWVVFDGLKDGGGFDAARLKSTGIPVVLGQTLDVAVTVHPSAKEWDVTISDGTNTYTGANLGFRRNAPSVGPYLHFGSRANGSSDSRSFSVDAIEIAPAWPASIEANFTRGVGTTYVDQRNGVAGRGWKGQWWGAGTGSSSVIATDPLDPADPNYLNVVATASGDRVVYREYESYGLVDAAAPHRISWKFRYDGDLGQMNSFDDRLAFFADDEGIGGTNAGNSWIIGWIAADRSGNDIHEDQWYFYDRGANSDFVKENMVNTGIGLETGRVYDFEVWVYPESGQYDATIFDGLSTFSAKGLTFRNGTTGEFNVLHFGGARSGGNSSWAFSLDAVTVSVVPEPSTLAMLALGAVALAGFWVRRRRSN